MPFVTLNNGFEIPILGFGTAFIDKKMLDSIINCAINNEFRFFDTAWKYKNEKNLGHILRKSGLKREDYYISTKISADSLYLQPFQYGKRGIFNIRNFKSIKKAIHESFKNLDTEYIDIFFIHWPWPMYLQMYETLTEYYHDGKIKAIGVCHFTEDHLNSLKEISDVIPAVNQIELSPLNTQKNLVEFCKSRGIIVQAVSTFSHYRSNEPRMEIINNRLLKNIASRYNKSVVQIVLKWLTQQNIIATVKSQNSQHIKENISIFDFELSKEEMDIIDSLDQGTCLNYNPYLPIILKSVPKKYRIRS